MTTGNGRPPAPIHVDEHTLFEMVPLDRVFADRYCRPIRQWQVSRQRRNWNVDKVGSLYVSLRNDGRYAVLDGNHRIAAARLEGITHLPARVYIDLIYQQEAELYNAFATQHKQSALDRFRALVEAEDRMALEIVAMLHRHGLRIGFNGPAVGCLQAVYALERIYRDHGLGVLDMVVRILHEAWGYTPGAYVTNVLNGTAALVARYNDAINERRLVTLLKHNGIDYLMQRASEYRSVRSMTETAWGRAMHDLYNRGLRAKGKLGPWEERADSGRRSGGATTPPSGPQAAAP